MTRITERLFYRIAKRWIAGYTLQDAIAVKPSQIGLAAEIPLYRDNLLKIIAAAEGEGRFVWIDMENSPYTESTVEIYPELLGTHKDLGLCLQANMKRTESDLRDLLPRGGKIRLVKGAYPENGEVAFKRRSELNANYLGLMHIL